jgi:putative radical SAM enzyme (TIGR03279 family)
MLKITKVKRNSVAKDLGLEVGDEIIAFDGHPCEDELDYLYYADKENFTITVRDGRTGEEVACEVEKDEDEDMGLEFAKNTTLKTCRNNCVFCFVDQMPKGMRESLYVKDDDYNMSFTCGNFVTLTNLSEEGLQRIIRLHLSPLYISVHTMNAESRCKLLRNRFAGRIRDQVRRLAEAGIEMHCQAVIVPGVNDGEELAPTARELFAYYPQVRDLAFVPTGLTKFRDGLTEIPDVDGEYSAKILDMADALNEEFGVNFLLPADEYFVKAGRAFKPVEFYGEFEQIENGIGMTSLFLYEVEGALRTLSKKKGGRCALKAPKKSVIVSGVSAEKVMQGVASAAAADIEGLTVDVLAVKNDFFGHTVTCTGLLTGKDMLAALEKYLSQNSADEVLLAGNTMKEFEDVFLCGMTLTELKTALAPYGVKVRVNRDGGAGLVKILRTDK